MDLTFVSTNAGKFREVRTILAEYDVGVRWRRASLPEIQAARLDDVVRAKLGAASRPGRYVLVEDSGLFLPALRGFPGVYSAYALQTIGLEGVLRLVGSDRRARFQTVAGLSYGGRQWLRSGACEGRLAKRPVGDHGFGYDPIFVPAGHRQTFGQMRPTEKNELSHRAHAIRRIGRLIHSWS